MFLLVSLLLLALMISQADSANTQGLHWGLKRGDRLDFVYEMHTSFQDGVAAANEKIHIIVGDLPALPDVLRTFQQAVCMNATVFWANGSAISESGMMTGVRVQLMIAVGNWPLLTDLYSSIRDLWQPWDTIIDEPSVWGIRSDHVVGTTLINESWTVSKSDGATIEYSSLMLDLISDTEILHVQLDRVVEGVSTTVLVSAAIISAEIIVAVLIIRRYRH